MSLVAKKVSELRKNCWRNRYKAKKCNGKSITFQKTRTTLVFKCYCQIASGNTALLLESILFVDPNWIILFAQQINNQMKDAETWRLLLWYVFVNIKKNFKKKSNLFFAKSNKIFSRSSLWIDPPTRDFSTFIFIVTKINESYRVSLTYMSNWTVYIDSNSISFF